MPNIYIRKVPEWLVTLNIMPKNVCFAIAQYIFLNQDRYNEFINNEQTPYTKAIIAHEIVHIQRAAAIGLVKFLFLYFFSKSFCLNEELEAIKVEMKVYKQYDKTFDTDTRAHFLATLWLYHNCVSYADAKKILDDMWQQI